MFTDILSSLGRKKARREAERRGSRGIVASQRSASPSQGDDNLSLGFRDPSLQLPSSPLHNEAYSVSSTGRVIER